jgi:hypothetical protein
MQKIKKRKFEHAVSLNFTVTSEHENWEDCLAKEKDNIMNSLMEKISTALSDHEQWSQAFEGFDTTEVTK